MSGLQYRLPCLGRKFFLVDPYNVLTEPVFPITFVILDALIHFCWKKARHPVMTCIKSKLISMKDSPSSSKGPKSSPRSQHSSKRLPLDFRLASQHAPDHALWNYRDEADQVWGQRHAQAIA